MYNLVKWFTVLVFVFSLSACSKGSGDQIQEKGQAAVDQVKNTLSAAAGSDAEELIHKQDHAAGYFGLGSAASAEEIAGWDIDIRPDGQGLPEGSGTVEDGEELFEAQCASCHGSFGEGAQGYPVLAGGEDSLTEARPEKTVGSYWPYASTLWDYIHRAMPFQAPESLEDDEVYAITAYVLYLNELVEDDFELTKDNFSSIEMPNQASFYRDDRPDVKATRCMENCKTDPVTITSTPENATYFVGDMAKKVSEVAAATAATASSEDTAAEPQDTLGEDTYQAACAMCHASGLAGAPVVGDAEQWTDRLAKGMDVLDHNAINGIGAMPAKGGQSQLSDEAVKAAVAFMLVDAE